MNLDSLLAERDAAGSDWDVALMTGDVELGELCAQRVRALSAQITAEVGVS